MRTVVTKKQINDALPRINDIRSEYRVQGSTGFFDKHTKTLEFASIAWDEGEAPAIYLKGIGETAERKVFNAEFDNFFDITVCIEEFISGYIDRKTCVDKIFDCICCDT
jgi:hypothetical protein